MNTRSLSLHLDKFHAFLSNLYFHVQGVGLSESKVSNVFLAALNTDPPTYTFHHTPLNSAADGVGFYGKVNLTAIKRNDL